MSLKLNCPSCTYVVASYDAEKNEYRVWIPNHRKLGDQAFLVSPRVTCKRCGEKGGWHTIPDILPKPYCCPNDGRQLAKQLNPEYGDGASVHLPNIGNELFCANARMPCQGKTCKQWVDLNVLRETGKGMSFEPDYSHLRNPANDVE
jgi:hypothetical protein